MCGAYFGFNVVSEMGVYLGDMRYSQLLFILVLATGLVSVGCGADSEPVANDGGAAAQAALASTDLQTTLCKGSSDGYSRGEAPVTRRMRRSASPLIVEPVPRLEGERHRKGEPWGTKAPIYVRTGTKPVEVAVMETGGATVGLAYDDWSAQKSPEAAYQRVRFAPCKGDPASPTWYGWPGSIVADRENVCLDLAIREENGDISLERISLGNGCPGERD